jgi:hypothetical protein
VNVPGGIKFVLRYKFAIGTGGLHQHISSGKRNCGHGQVLASPTITTDEDEHRQLEFGIDGILRWPIG